MSETKLTRREALKAIAAAAGGLTAAAFLPSQWLKPVVKAGVLPVHARASVTHIMVDPTNGNGSLGSVLVYVYNPSNAGLVGAGFGAGIGNLVHPGTPVPRIAVTINSITPSRSGKTLDLSLSWRTPVGGSQSHFTFPIGPINTDLNGEAAFGSFDPYDKPIVGQESQYSDSYTFNFSASNCASIDIVYLDT